MAPQRVLFYSHDTVGLGHIRRVSRIAERLARRDREATILILTGSTAADLVRLPSNVDVVKLPSLRKVENSWYEPRRLGMDRADLLMMRERLIHDTIVHFAPDLFVVDKAPIGVHGELRRSLRELRAAGGCRIVLGLRDILDSTEETVRSWTAEGIYDALRRYYDQILVWGMREVCDLVEEYRLPPDVARKVEYCGYIAPENTAVADDAARAGDKRLVLATVGGGEDGFFLLDSFVRSLRSTEERFASVILTGPDLPREQRTALQRLVAACGRPVFMVDFARQIGRLVAAADLVVAMGGYNTTCEIVSRGRPAIVVPRSQPRQEQVLRAERFQSRGLLRMIRPEELTPEGLARAIDEELRMPARRPSLPLDFGGLDRAEAHLSSVASANGAGNAVSTREGVA